MSKVVMDIDKWAREAIVLRNKYEKQICDIACADHQYQNARGGEIQSAMTERANAAAQKVADRRDRAAREFAAEKFRLIDPEMDRLRAEALKALIAAGDAMASLLALENAVALFCRDTRQPQRPRVVDSEVVTRAREFEARLARVRQVATAAPARAQVVEPDFATFIH